MKILNKIRNAFKHIINSIITAKILRDIQDEKGSKVLLFGAFGNGNMGDAEQARFINDLLKKYQLTGSYHVVATSYLRVDSYDFRGKTLPYSAIMDFNILNKFDLIIIGGGGLLGHPHFPLFDVSWVNELVKSKIPYILCAVGFERDLPQYREAYSKLISSAEFVSGRDDSTLSTMRTYRNDVSWMLDPILNSILPSNIEKAQSKTNRIDIVIRPVKEDDVNIDFLKALQEVYRKSSREEIRIIFLEPNLPEEKLLMKQFPEHLVCRSMPELITAVQDAKVGISMRFHGVIGMIGAQIPVIGLSSFPKISNLMTMFCVADQYYHDAARDLIPLIMSRKFDDVRPASVTPEFLVKIKKAEQFFLQAVTDVLEV